MQEEKKYELELEVSVSPNGETVWLTQKQMALLFNVTVDNISLHIKNILNATLIASKMKGMV